MFIYMTICTINNKKYIGKYEGNESDNYLGSGKLLRRAIKKYGAENFNRIILERFQTKEEVRAAEIKYIQKYNAVNSNEFYNIASGGEGGNTFAGIKGMSRKSLIKKLKSRKKPDPENLRNRTTARNLITGNLEKILCSEFNNSLIHVGVACKGIYITPFGNFSSTSLMNKIIGIDYTSLVNKCKNNLRIIKKSHFQAKEIDTPYYQNLQLYMGRTFLEAGYNFIPITDILYKDLDFYKKINILKII